MQNPDLDAVLTAWRLSKCHHELNPPASDTEIEVAESALHRPLPTVLKAMYRFSNGAEILGGNLAWPPLRARECELSLVTSTAAMREWGWPVPDQVLLFAGNGSDDHFGLWLPNAKTFPDPFVVVIGAVFEPDCMALAGTSLSRFLKSWTASYLLVENASPNALDALELPAKIREMPASERQFTACVRWADPSLGRFDLNPYKQRLDIPAVEKAVETLLRS